MKNEKMKSYWEYIGGHQWSLIDTVDIRYEPNGYDKHVCSVEIERGKCPTVAYISRELTKNELEELLTIVMENNL